MLYNSAEFNNFLRDFRLGVKPGELLNVQSSVAVAIEVPEEESHSWRREAKRRTLQDAGRLFQGDVPIAVDVVLPELRHQLWFTVDR